MPKNRPFAKGGRGSRAEKVWSGNLLASKFRRAKSLKTFDFMHVTISHNLKDPHSKTLQPDCLSPLM